jgi:protein-S-isoprenylcysteine O-methyltransferase Ste14
MMGLVDARHASVSQHSHGVVPSAKEADQMSPTKGTAAAPEDSRASGDVRTARLLVAGQFLLIGVLVVLPNRDDWAVPAALTVACSAATVLGLAVMVIGAIGLGRGLTATPLPNARAQLRTGGLYRYVRHPIYSGLMLVMASITVAAGSVLRLLALAALVVLLNVKARWEETRLAQRFEGYADYATLTPRFLPLRLRRSR